MAANGISAREQEFVRSGERLDDLYRNGYMIIQNPDKFCFGIDAVLLAGFAKVNKDEVALDLGTGTGIIPILLEAKTDGDQFVGLEIQKAMAEMAQRSVKYNFLDHKIYIQQGDLKEIDTIFKPDSFDVVTSNPPYISQGAGKLNDVSAKAIAKHEIRCKLKDVIWAAARMLRMGGRFYMVHRVHRIPDIICLAREYSMEVKNMRLVHSYVDSEPNLVLVEMVKGGKPGLKILKPLVVYTEDNKYTQEVNDIYYK